MDILVRKALESLAENRGTWDGERDVISADIVNKFARHILDYLDAPVASDALPDCTRPENTDCHAKINTGGKCMNGFQCPTVASDARELAIKVYQKIDGRLKAIDMNCIGSPEGAISGAASLIESFAAERERKAREETARKCAEAAVKFFDLAPAGELSADIHAAIMEAAHE